MNVYPVASKLSWGRKGTAWDFFSLFYNHEGQKY